MRPFRILNAFGAAKANVRRVWPHRGRLLLAVDDAGWIIDEIGQTLVTRLPSHLRARVVDREWIAARDCTIHFISRPWAFSEGVLDRAHPSNRVLGLWWHGRLDTDDREMRAALDRLRRVHERFDRIQITCSSGRRTLLELGVPSGKLVQLPEGVDMQLFRPTIDAEERLAVRRSLGIPDDALAIGCFQKDGAGWGEGAAPKLVKGPDVLADALGRLMPGHRVHAVLPGPSRGYLTRRLSLSGVPFTAPGFIARSALPRLYHGLDVYVSPSRDEGGPAGVLEAMASGVPVVSTRTGMAEDLIETGQNGLLTPIGDATALADAVLLMAESPVERMLMARRARVTIAACDWAVVAKRYADELYEPAHRAGSSKPLMGT